MNDRNNAPHEPEDTNLTVKVEPEKLIWLDPQRLSFRDPGAGRPISMTIADDRTYRSIFALRAFPRQEPNGFIQIFQGNTDETRGEMVGMIRGIAQLRQSDAETLAEALRRSYLVPRITAILELEEHRFMARWVVDTDRGVRSFDMYQPHRNVIGSGSGRVLMVDVEENRYEIPDVEDLDDASRRRLDRVL